HCRCIQYLLLKILLSPLTLSPKSFTTRDSRTVEQIGERTVKQKILDRNPVTTKSTTCSVKDCENPRIAFGLCTGHYKRKMRYGDAHAEIPLRNWKRNPDYTPPVEIAPAKEEPAYFRPACVEPLYKKEKHQ